MQPIYRLPATILILWILLVTDGWAETRYITDQLVVSLRGTPQDNAESITYLRTDTPVEVIEETGDFIKVKTGEGEIGYIKNHYLTKETPKSTVIRRLQQERDRLATTVTETKKQLASARSNQDQATQELQASLDETRSELETLQKKYLDSQAALQHTKTDYQELQEDTQNVASITRERDQLRVNNEELTARISKLEEEVSSLMKTGIIKWFLAGGGVLFFGWIIGRLSGSRRRRSSL